MEKDLEDNGKMRGKDIENLVNKPISSVYGSVVQESIQRLSDMMVQFLVA